MIKIRKLLIFIGFLSILISLSTPALSKVGIYAQDIDARLEYDNNVTQQRLHENYQDGIIWRLYTGFGIKDFIPVKWLETDAKYSLRMRDVNTTNNEDYNSHEAEFKLKAGNKLYMNEAIKVWNSQNDLFNFYDNVFDASFSQNFGKKTTLYLSYKGEQKWFQNKAPEVQARNYYYHQLGVNIYHTISEDFQVRLGYVDQIKTYNRRPIDFKNGRPIVLKGIQRDRQKIVMLGFDASMFNNTSLSLSDQIIKSDSNSRVFNFDGNRTQIVVLSNPFQWKLWVELTYQLVAYNIGAYQTPDLGYELSETRTDDQSGIKIGLTYDVSDQVSLKVNYEHLRNTVFFTKDFYESNTASVGMKLKF